LAFVGFLGYPIAVIADAANSFEEVKPGEEARMTITPWYDAHTRSGGFTMHGLF
jgi:hypothetical protein